MAQPMYPELNLDIIIVRRPVFGPSVAIKDTEQVANAPKHSIVTAAILLSQMSVTYALSDTWKADSRKRQIENGLRDHTNRNSCKYCIYGPMIISQR